MEILIISSEYAGVISIVSPFTLKFPGATSRSFRSYLASTNFRIKSVLLISSPEATKIEESFHS